MTETGNFEIGIAGSKSQAAMQSANLPQTVLGGSAESMESSFEEVLVSMRTDNTSEDAAAARKIADCNSEEVCAEDSDVVCKDSTLVECEKPMAEEADKQDEVASEDLVVEDAISEEPVPIAALVMPVELTQPTVEVGVVEGTQEVLLATDAQPAQTEVAGEQKAVSDATIQTSVADQDVLLEGASKASVSSAKEGSDVSALGKAIETAVQTANAAKPDVNPMLANQESVQTQMPAYGDAIDRGVLGANVQDAPAASFAAIVDGQQAVDGGGVESDGSGLLKEGAPDAGDASLMRGEIGHVDGARSAEFVSKLNNAQESIRADQPQTVDKMVKTMRVAFEKGTSKVRIMLDPPQLGSVRVNMSIKDGILSASFETQSQAARHVLSQDLSLLKTALENQGIEVGEFTVNVESGDTQSQTFGDASERLDGSIGGRTSSADASEVEDEPYDILAEQRRMMAGTSVLDLIA